MTKDEVKNLSYEEKKKLLNHIENMEESLKKELRKLKEDKKKLTPQQDKFIFIISNELDHYISWASNSRNMHKAQIVRDSIEYQMLHDNEYQKHVGNI